MNTSVHCFLPEICLPQGDNCKCCQQILFPMKYNFEFDFDFAPWPVCGTIIGSTIQNLTHSFGWKFGETDTLKSYRFSSKNEYYANLQFICPFSSGTVIFTILLELSALHQQVVCRATVLELAESTAKTCALFIHPVSVPRPLWLKTIPTARISFSHSFFLLYF